MQRDLEYSILAQNVTMAAISHPLKQECSSKAGYYLVPIKYQLEYCAKIFSLKLILKFLMNTQSHEF